MSNKRRVIFSPGEIYHIFNRSIANEPIFTKGKGLERFVDLLYFYKYEQDIRFSFFNRLSNEKKKEYLEGIKDKTPLIELFTFALMPNHFHLLIKEVSETGIKTYLSNIQNGYAKYFNIRNNRFGALFLKPFKAKYIENDEQLLHISRYVHLNPVTSYLIDIEELSSNPITSYPNYLRRDNSHVNTEFIINLSGSVSKYKKFVENQTDYQRRLNKIKHLLME